MNAHLSAAQRAEYDRKGYFHPLRAMSPQEARGYRDELESFEARLGSRLSEGDPKWRSRIHLLCDWGRRLVSHPAILDAVESVIGPDILVWTSTFFIKEPGQPHVAGWHQDATYFGLVPNDVHVTAWLALSDATAESGCMSMLSGSHRDGQLPHGTGMVSSVNVAGQFLLPPVPEHPEEVTHLKAGEFSLHNTLTVHQSGPNRSGDRRIGIGISYVPASVRHGHAAPLPVFHVRGAAPDPRDFTCEAPPAGDYSEAARCLHEASFTRSRANYHEQVRRHAETFKLDLPKATQ